MQDSDSCGPSPEPRRQFPFMVDCEKLVAYSQGDTAELTVREILDMSGNQPAEEYALVMVGPPPQKFEQLDHTVLVKPDAKFKALFRGPTPVS